MTREAKNPVKATQRSFAILEVIYERKSARLTDISERLGLSPSTVHNHLSTLVEAGFVTRSDGVYYISLNFLTYGEVARDRYKVSEAAQTELGDLASETGEAGSVAVAEDGFGYILIHESGSTDLPVDIFPGKRLPLHATSFGKVLLADRPDEDVEDVLDEYGKLAYTSKTIVDTNELIDELATIRSQGYAICNEERLRGIRSIASTVRNERGVAVGAIGITGPASRLTDDRLRGSLLDTLIDTKNVIELQIAHS